MPFAVSEVALPSVVELVVTAITWGCDHGRVTVNAIAGEEAVLVFCTVTFGDPAEASWALATVAVSEVVLPGVVGLVASGFPPHSTLEPATKFVPITVSAKPAPPATAEVGLSDAIIGLLTVNAIAEDEAVLVFCTVIFGDPAEAS